MMVIPVSGNQFYAAQVISRVGRYLFCCLWYLAVAKGEQRQAVDPRSPARHMELNFTPSVSYWSGATSFEDAHASIGVHNEHLLHHRRRGRRRRRCRLLRTARLNNNSIRFRFEFVMLPIEAIAPLHPEGAGGCGVVDNPTQKSPGCKPGLSALLKVA
jgi:hypothetical protein